MSWIFREERLVFNKSKFLGDKIFLFFQENNTNNIYEQKNKQETRIYKNVRLVCHGLVHENEQIPSNQTHEDQYQKKCVMLEKKFVVWLTVFEILEP